MLKENNTDTNVTKTASADDTGESGGAGLGGAKYGGELSFRGSDQGALGGVGRRVRVEI